MEIKNKSMLADFSLLIMALIWGSGFIFTKNTLDSLTGIQLIFIRFLIAFVTLFIFNIKKLNLIKKSTIYKSIIIGFVLFLGFAFQTYGLVETPAGKSAFLTAVYVAIVPFIAMFIGENKPEKHNFIAAFLMIIGIFFLTMNPKEGFSINYYDGITLIGSIFWAFHVFFVGHFSKGEDPIILCMMQMFFAGVFAFVLLLFNGEISTFNITGNTIPTLLYLGVIASAVTFLIQNVAQKYTSPTHAGILMSMESVFGTILGIIFLNEVFSMQMLVGAVIIFTALILAETKFEFLKRKTLKE
ncbi:MULTISPECIES: DMT family transporter [Anaerofustis]|uniref:DMT family transporter n=1 Tax=Anaerofustis TaxID=264995 RepID=UPI0011075B8B|nr:MULTISPECIES: DMT family transporter [Anaerofustis]MCO8193794.1 DMT family transporter [Anaerofustis sp. NSJ-163]